jgi:hypothetical protein
MIAGCRGVALPSVSRFPLRRSPWALVLFALFAPVRSAAVVDDEAVSVKAGLLGGARIPLATIDRVGTMYWPWWGGLGVRIARGMVAFVERSGTLVVLELSEPVPTRAPLRWSADKIAIGVEDPEGFMAAIAEARQGGGLPDEAPPAAS